MLMITSVILLMALASAFSPLFSSLQPYPQPFYAFAQTQENAALSLSNIIKQGATYQGSTSAPVTLIDFSDLQCHLCDRFVKAAAVESMPISFDETFKFNYDAGRGVILEFGRTR